MVGIAAVEIPAPAGPVVGRGIEQLRTRIPGSANFVDLRFGGMRHGDEQQAEGQEQSAHRGLRSPRR